jgi:hypothetical protein
MGSSAAEGLPGLRRRALEMPPRPWLAAVALSALLCVCDEGARLGACARLVCVRVLVCSCVCVCVCV